MDSTYPCNIATTSAFRQAATKNHIIHLSAINSRTLHSMLVERLVYCVGIGFRSWAKRIWPR